MHTKRRTSKKSRAWLWALALAAVATPVAVSASRGGSEHEGVLQVELDGEWRDVCCHGRVPQVSDRECWWTESGRRLTDEDEDEELDCSEGGPSDCECDGSGQPMHGFGGGHVERSLGARGGGPVYPDYSQRTCVVVDDDGDLVTEWTSSDCPHFRLR